MPQTLTFSHGTQHRCNFLFMKLKRFGVVVLLITAKKLTKVPATVLHLLLLLRAIFVAEKKNWHFETKVIPKCFSSEVWKIKFSVHCLFQFLFSDDEQTSGIYPFASVNFFVFWLGSFKQQVIFFFALRDSSFSLLTSDCPVLNSSFSYIITHSIPTRIVTCH